MEALAVGIFTRAREGEVACGDACLVKEEEGLISLALVDGIGHGEEASRAAGTALACMEANIYAGLEAIFRLCHQQLTGTRGAVAALCQVSRHQGFWQAAIVGNIFLQIMAAKSFIPLATAGILGYNYPRRLLSNKGPFHEGDLILMHSDGIKDGSVTPEWLRSTGLSLPELARQIGRKYGRRDDDVAVIVAR